MEPRVNSDERFGLWVDLGGTQFWIGSKATRKWKSRYGNDDYYDTKSYGDRDKDFFQDMLNAAYEKGSQDAKEQVRTALGIKTKGI